MAEKKKCPESPISVEESEALISSLLTGPITLGTRPLDNNYSPRVGDSGKRAVDGRGDVTPPNVIPKRGRSVNPNDELPEFPKELTQPDPEVKGKPKSRVISIAEAMDLSYSDPLLIGDCTKRHVLPIMDEGRHKDLKEITGHTLASLLDGTYGAGVSFEVIDCRYPYEYAGGHVRGAVNLYTDCQVFDKFMAGKESLPEGSDSDSEDRRILIFHCEFSKQRGPGMYRNLRQWDRLCNEESFPYLHYPELYLLNGGFKDFFAAYPGHCDPPTYTPMVEESCEDQLRFFTRKTKSETLTKAKVKEAQTPKKKTDRRHHSDVNYGL